MKKTRKVMSITLVLCAILTLLPVSASAATDNRVEKAISWAVAIAKDNTHGYSMSKRYGPDYDCSSFVSAAFKYGGFNVSSNLWTGNMEQAFKAAGFKVYAANSVTLQRGDILLRHDNTQQHVELYLGNNQCVAAHWDDDGRTGDSGGHEIEVRSKAYCDFCNYKQYTRILRYEGGSSDSSKPKVACFDCDVTISTTKGRTVNLYKNIGDSQRVDYFDQGQTAYSTKGAKVSDGSTWYQIRAYDQNHNIITVWLNAGSSGVKIVNNKITSEISAGVYVIQTAIGNNSMVLDCEKGSQAAGANILLWDRHNAANQQICVVPLDNGNYALQLVHSGQVLDVAKASKESGASVIQWNWNAGLNQQWKIIPAGDGTYHVISALSGMALDVSGGHATPGANIIVYQPHYGSNQRFNFIPVK